MLNETVAAPPGALSVRDNRPPDDFQIRTMPLPVAVTMRCPSRAE